MHTTDMTPMLMHRDMLPSFISSQSDCDCDCDCDYNVDISHNSLNKLMTLGDTSSQEYFQISLGLYRAPLDEQHELIFNPLSQAGVIVLDHQASRLLNTFDKPRLIFDALNFSTTDTYTREKSLVEQLIAIELLTKSGDRPIFHPPSPQTLAIWMHVTNECNLRCTYCYLDKTTESMPPEIGRRAIDMVFATAQRYGFSIVKIKFAGGEATLNLPLMFDLQTYAREKARVIGVELQSVILSNGIAISHRTARALKEADIRVMISLDGIGEYHDAQRTFANGRGSFDLVNRAISTLLEVGLIPNISVTISEKNLDGLPTLIDYILDRDLPFSLSLYRENDCSMSFADIQFSEQHVIEAMLRVLNRIEQRLPARSLLGSLTDKASFIAAHDKTCGVGMNYMVIDQYGKVAKCQMEIERPITTIFAADPMRVIRDDKKSVQNISVDEKEGCRDCTWRYWCAGGCPIHTYRATGRYDIKSPNCNIYKALFPAVLRLEGLRILKFGQ